MGDIGNKNKNGAGKGDSPRRVDQKRWDEGWERIFGKGENKKAEESNKGEKTCPYCGKGEKEHSEKLCSTH